MSEIDPSRGRRVAFWAIERDTRKDYWQVYRDVIVIDGGKEDSVSVVKNMTAIDAK